MLDCDISAVEFRGFILTNICFRWFSKKLQQKRKLSSPLSSPYAKRGITCLSQYAVYEEVTTNIQCAMCDNRQRLNLN